MRSTGVSVLALLAAALPVQTWAAEPAPDPAPGGEPIGEIVVAAERTNVTLQKAALSVSAVSDDSLKKANITEITGLNGSVPGLSVAKSGGGERQIAIRGIGSQTPENPSTQPGVSFHIDGVYIFNSVAANAAFIDVSQIEVLRGPQGTMYGQGSTGGTINVVSQQPDPAKVSGSVDLGYGNYNLFKADAALNVPITDTLAVRAAVHRLKHDGYGKATDVADTSSYDLDDANEWSTKVAAKWQPTDRISVLLSTIQSKTNQNAPEQKNVLDPNDDAREVTQDYPGKTYIRTQLYYGVVKFDLDFATFSSISSYQKMHSKLSWDSDGLNASLFNAVSGGYYNYDHTPLWEQKTESYTQEYNLASDPKGRFRWIVGGVYLHTTNGSYINEYRSGTGDGLDDALPQDTAYDDPSVGNLAYAELSSVTREAYAVYGQASFDLTDRLTVTAGARFNHDKYSATSDSVSGTPNDYTSGAYLQPSIKPGTSTSRVTGKFALDYDVTPTNMVYASYTRGFKPGGLNASATGNSSYYALGFENGIKGSYKPEMVDSFEIGSKNRFFGNTLQINASAFYYFYKDMQFIEDDAILFQYGISNAPKAEIYGAELETEWRATSHLKFEGSLSATQGKFTADYLALDPAQATAAQNAAGYFGIGGYYGNFYAASLVRDGARQNINGNKVPQLPTIQGSAAVTWTGDIGPGELTARAQYIYRGKMNSRVFDNGSQDHTPSYQQVNLYAGYTIADTGLTLSATVTNLFDVNGINSRYTDPYGSAQVFDTYIPPRQAIFSVGYKF